MSEPEIVLCGEAPPAGRFWEPCPLQAGHDEEHLFWWGGRVGRNKSAVWVVNAQGQTSLHADMRGAVSAVDVHVLLVMRQLLADREAMVDKVLDAIDSTDEGRMPVSELRSVTSLDEAKFEDLVGAMLRRGDVGEEPPGYLWIAEAGEKRLAHSRRHREARP